MTCLLLTSSFLAYTSAHKMFKSSMHSTDHYAIKETSVFKSTTTTKKIMHMNNALSTDILTGNEIHLYMMSTTNLLILFCVWIEVKRVKRSQFDAVWMMLERCMIRKVVMQSFHSCDNTSSNSHNWSTKKINDMSMSVRDEKILLVKKTTQMKSLQVVTTSDWRICNSLTALISKRLHHIDSVIK